MNLLFHSRIRFVVLLFLVTTFICSMSLGQRTSASISGTVADPSGAVVPNAHVVATSISTGASVTVQSNDQGFYIVSDLGPGSYKVQVEAPGFQRYERTGVVLQVGQSANINVNLRLGAESMEVVVSGAPPLVDTRNQTVSFAITPQFTEQIPLNGRNVLQLLSLAPDTSGRNPTNYAYSNQEATRPEAAEGMVTASGESRENSTTFYLDGGLNEDTYTNVANIFPNPDAVQEFTFDTNSYSAKFGGRGGGVVNAATRSGTNQFHGSAFEYLRNGKVNASNYFSTEPDKLNRNQFGFSFGGPIQKDKTFGFLSFQRTTLRFGTTANVVYGPTAAEMAGDWSGVGQQLSDPFTGDPFSNNYISPSLYNPISLKVLQLVPKADPIDGRINYLSRESENDNQWVARVDRNFGQKLSVYGSFLWDGLDHPNKPDPTNILTGGPDKKWRSQHAALNGTYRVSNNLLTTLTASYSRALIRYSGSTVFPSLPDLGANYPVWDPVGVKEAGFYISGWFGAQWLGRYDITRNQYDFNNNWTWVKGNHTFDFGGELMLTQSILYQAYSSSGYQGWWCASSGFDPLDFMLGANCYFEQYAPSYVAPHGKSPSLYANDTWRATRRLTLNLGLRWEPWLPWPDTSSQKIGVVLNPTAFANGQRATRYPNLPPGMLLRGDPGVPSGLAAADWKLFDPRIGVAWDLFGDGKTSLRAGFGIYHDQPFGRMYNQMTSTVPFTQGALITGPVASAYDPYTAPPYNGQVPPLMSPLPSNTVFPLPLDNAVGFAPGFKPPATLQWNLTLERQLGHGILLRGGYEASESYHMFDSRDINSAIYDPATGEANRPWASFYGGQVIWDESRITSSYNALAITAEKRMTSNLSFLGGYRWAKCIDFGGSASSFAFDDFTDSRNIGLDRGLCDSDIASQFKLATVWRAPSIASLGFFGRNVISGWTLSGIWNSHSGFPLSVMANGDFNMDGNYYDRANLVGNPHLPGDRSRAEKLQAWFNPAAFDNPPIGSNGNTGRNFLRGPGYANLDLSIAKSFAIPYGPLRESQKLDFRAEFFNALNHPNFYNPNNGVGGVAFAAIQSAQDPRIMQFTLKYIF